MNERLRVTNARISTLTNQLHQLRDHFKRKRAQILVEEEPSVGDRKGGHHQSQVETRLLI